MNKILPRPQCVIITVRQFSSPNWVSFKYAVKVEYKFQAENISEFWIEAGSFLWLFTCTSFLYPPSSIGYPVVYLGFYATCYFTNIFKLRIQKAVQNDNDFHMHLLQNSLPPVLQVYPKSGSDGSSCKCFSPVVRCFFPLKFSLQLLDRHESCILQGLFICAPTRSNY